MAEQTYGEVKHQPVQVEQTLPTRFLPLLGN